MQKTEQCSPKDFHALTPRDCEYIILYGKRHFAVMIKVKNLKTGKLSWIIWVGLI